MQRLIEDSGEFQIKTLVIKKKKKSLLHSINFAAILFNSFDCPQEVWSEAKETNSNHRKFMFLNFDLALIAEDYVSEFVTHVGKTLKMEKERTNRDNIILEHRENRKKKESRREEK